MKWQTILPTVLGLALLAGPTLAADPKADEAAGPQSIRGATPVDGLSEANPMATYPSKGKAMPRGFLHQPPLIPHKADYPQTGKRNSCNNCHDPAKAERMKATPTHESHYVDGRLSGQYYTCNRCHVPQVDNQ